MLAKVKGGECYTMPGEKDSPKIPPEWRKDVPLGEELRQQYKDILNEPVPEKLKQLIEALKEKEREERKKQDEE